MYTHVRRWFVISVLLASRQLLLCLALFQGVEALERPAQALPALRLLQLYRPRLLDHASWGTDYLPTKLVYLYPEIISNYA